MAADLEIRIGAELTEIKGALASLQRDLRGVGALANQTGGQQAFTGLQNSARAAANQLKVLVAGFVSLAAAIRLIQTGDELQNLSARLRLATQSVEEFNRAQAALFEVSQRTGSSLSETIDLYSRIALATRDAGVGQEVLLDVVTTINQAVQLSGASAQAAQAALVQLGQGLASGTLRGEELNSILEQTPRLADAIARGLGITRGELRSFGEQGRLSAQAVIQALQQQAGVIDGEFRQLPLTVGRAVTQLRNSFAALVGVFNETSGTTSGIAAVIQSLADYLASDEATGALIQFGAIWSDTFGRFAEDVRRAVQAVRDATSNITGSGEDLLAVLTRAFRDLPVNIRASIQIITVQATALFDRLVANARFVKDAFRAIFTDDTIEAAEQRRNARVQASRAAQQAAIDDILAERTRILQDSAAVRRTAEETRRIARQRSTTTAANSAGTFRAAQTDAQRREAEAIAKARLDAEERLARDSAERQLETEKARFADGLISAAAYYAARERIELAAVDRSIAIERQRAQAGGAESVKALAEIQLLERRKTDIQAQSARERAEFERRTDAELTQARAQELENQGQTAQAARLRLEAQYRDLLRTLRAEGNQAGVQLIEGLINAGAARAAFDQIKADFDRTLQDLQRRQQAIASQRETGAISGDVAQEQQRTARAQALEQLEALNAQLQALAANTNDPRIIEGAQATSNALQQAARDSATGWEAASNSLRASLANLEANFEQTVAGAGVDALTGLFTDLVDGSKSAGEAIRDFARGFIQSMAQVAARALATFVVLQLLDGLFPGAGRLVAAGGGAAASVQHGGGMAGTGPRRRVNPALFLAAPRYHAGGMVGLKPDERPAILQTGEEVLSRGDPRNQANGGGGVRVINVIDPSLVSDYMTSSAGEKSVLNILQRNPGAVRQVLA